MIGWLHGQVLHHHKDGAIVLDVHDVGYEVSVASQEDYRVGDVVDLYIFTAVRDDAIVLYGFPSYLDREFFELLLVTPGRRTVDRARPPFARCRPVTWPTAIDSDDAKTDRHHPGHRAQDRQSHRARAEGQGRRAGLLRRGEGRRRRTTPSKTRCAGWATAPKRCASGPERHDAVRRRRRGAASGAATLEAPVTRHEIDVEQLARHVVAPVADEQDRRAEVSLRPGTLAEFVGQRELVRHLEIVLGSARARQPDRRSPLVRRTAGTRQDLAGDASSRPRWARVCASPRDRCSRAPVTWPRCSPTSKTATSSSSTRSTDSRAAWKRSSTRRWRTDVSTS